MGDDPRQDDQNRNDAEQALPAGEGPENVIALSRFRAELGRARRRRRMDALLSQPRPEDAIRTMPGDELYYLLREQDLRESTEILVHASAEQIQTAMDLGLWSKRELVPARLAEWTETLAEMPPATLLAWMRGLDTELVGLLIRRGAHIYDLTLEEAPDESQGIFFPTPDGFFVLDVTGYDGAGGEPEVTASALVRILDKLYRADLTFMRRILVGARAEMDAELEEAALRWRQGRLADLGFADPEEALEVYRELDPSSVRIGEGESVARVRPRDGGAAAQLLGAPRALLERLSAPSLFTKTIARVVQAEDLGELQFQLVALTNRVLSADGVEPGDDDAVAATARRIQATLDLALEFLARTETGAVDEDRALAAVRTVTFVRLFRLGVSLVGKVRALARSLRREGPYAAVADLDLIEEPEATVFEALRRRHPVFPRILDDPPASGERPFGSLADLAHATAAIQRAGAAQAMLQRLGVDASRLTSEELGAAKPDRSAIDTGVLARTALVILLTAKKAKADEHHEKHASPSAGAKASTAAALAFRPLTPDEAESFAGGKQATSSPAIAANAAKLLDDVVAAVVTGAPGMKLPARQMAERWLVSLSPLESVLVAPPPPSRERRPRSDRPRR